MFMMQHILLIQANLSKFTARDAHTGQTEIYFSPLLTIDLDK